MQKVFLYILSLWLLFLLVFLLTLNLSVFSNLEELSTILVLKANIVPIICLIFLIIGLISFYMFRFHYMKGTTELSSKITKIKNKDYEHLTFLTTYIIPFLSFNLLNVKYLLTVGILLIVIGVIYVKTDLFYANPTLAVLGFRLYEIDLSPRHSKELKNIIIISPHLLHKGDMIEYRKITEEIFFALNTK